MKILVYTITYNRLNLTREYLGSLREKTNVPFNHVIFDNGSTDGTIEFLKDEGYKVIPFGENLGITEAQNRGLKQINYDKYDLIIKFDNDCEVVTDNILEKIVEFYKHGLSENYILSPIDLNLDPNYKPYVLSKEQFNGFNLEITTHNGGMFRVMTKKAMDSIINADIRMDVNEGKFWREKGFKVGYFKDFEVIHQGLNLTSKNYIL